MDFKIDEKEPMTLKKCLWKKCFLKTYTVPKTKSSLVLCTDYISCY